jgi:hypothetical protein
LIALLLLTVTTAGVWAQNLPNNIWTSPQSATTEGRYRSNADDFIRPDAYLGVKFNKWFGMTSFLSDENYSGIATVGFATQVSNVYIGAFYNGNLWAGAPVNDYTEMEPVTVPLGGSAGKVYDVYNTINVAPAPVNNIALIVGAYDMGFRITYRTNHQSFDESGIVVGNQLYKNYSAGGGYLAPQIAWAMAKDLTPNGIRPYATVDLVFYRDNLKTETSGPDSAGISGSRIGRSANHFDPSIGLGLGGYAFYNKDGFKVSADLDYVLTLNIYDNEYSYVEDGKYKTGTIKGTFSPGSFPYVEQSFMSNQFTPSVSGSWSEDRVALKFKLNLPLTFTSREQNDMGLNDKGNLVYNGANDSTFAFTFRPDLRLAFQYKLVPSRLTLNVGARIQATAITLQTTDREYYNDGEKVSSQKIHSDSYGSGFVNRFSLGPTFNFTDNIWIEANTGVSNVYGDGAIEVFAPGGLFSFGSILVALKF